MANGGRILGGSRNVERNEGYRTRCGETQERWPDSYEYELKLVTDMESMGVISRIRET